MQPTDQREEMPALRRDEVIALPQRTGADPALIQHVVTLCERALKFSESRVVRDRSMSALCWIGRMLPAPRST
jgi:hypothetical protein